MVHNCNGVAGSEKRLRILNNGVKLEVWKSPKSNFVENETMLHRKTVLI